MSWHYCFCWALRDTQGRKANLDLIPANTSPVRLCSCLGKRREVPPHAGQHKQTLLQSQPGHQFNVWPRNYLTSAHLPSLRDNGEAALPHLLTGFRAVELLGTTNSLSKFQTTAILTCAAQLRHFSPELGLYFVIKSYSLFSRKMCSPHITAVSQSPATLWQPFPLTVLI